MKTQTAYVLSIEYIAIERCFLVAEILSAKYGRDYTEYGLLGLSLRERPFHVIATPLLPGQTVTAGSVHQSGHHVFRLKNEMCELSKKLGQPLMPITFIHRHPGACDLSSIDEEFLTKVFIDQVATTQNLREVRVVEPAGFQCGCRESEQYSLRIQRNAKSLKPVTVEYGVCFSIVVNGEHQYSVVAAKKRWCPFCHSSRAALIDAKLEVVSSRKLTSRQSKQLRKELEVEIEAKVAFEDTL